MASIYKRPESQTWQCQYYVKDPNTGETRKVRTSTGKKTKSEARQVAADLERKAKLVMKAGSPQAQQVQAILAKVGVEIEKETFVVPTAHKYLGQLVKIATGEDMIHHTVESWCDEWLRRKARGRKEGDSTMKRYRKHVATFLDWLGDQRRKKPLESVQIQDLRKWSEGLQDSGLSGVTVKNHLKDLGAIYRGAVREGLVSFNPCESIISEISTDDSMSRKPFEMDEIRSLIKASPSKEWKGLILVAAFTGLRLGDAAGLLWKKVDIKARRISLTPSKTRSKKREVLIPIQEDLLDFIKSLPGQGKCSDSPLFPTLARTRVQGSKGLSNTFTDVIMANAGVSRGNPSREPVENEPKGKGRVTYERGFHSFRHTFTTWLRNADVSEEDRMALTGHSTRESHQRYSHVKESKLRDAIGKLPGLNKRTEARAAGAPTEADLSTIAASLPTGSPEERVKNARLILESVKSQTRPPTSAKAWFETEPLEKLLDETMPYESADERIARYKEYLMWAARQDLESARTSRMMDNTILGNQTTEAQITDEMVLDLANRTMVDQTANGVKQAEAVASQFKIWNRNQSASGKSTQSNH